MSLKQSLMTAYNSFYIKQSLWIVGSGYLLQQAECKIYASEYFSDRQPDEARLLGFSYLLESRFLPIIFIAVTYIANSVAVYITTCCFTPSPTQTRMLE